VGGVGCRRTEAGWRGGERGAVLAGVGKKAGETDNVDRDGGGMWGGEGEDGTG